MLNRIGNWIILGSRLGFAGRNQEIVEKIWAAMKKKVL